MFGCSKRRIMKIIIEAFRYLQDKYEMKVLKSCLHGSFPQVIWSNGHKRVKIVFDFTDSLPVHIFIYDEDDEYMFQYTEIAEELKFASASDKTIDEYVVHAARIFLSLLENKTVNL